MSKKQKRNRRQKANQTAVEIPAEFFERLEKIVHRPPGNQEDAESLFPGSCRPDSVDWQTVQDTFSLPKKSAFRINCLNGVQSAAEIERGIEALDFNTFPIPWCPGSFWIEPEYRDALIDSALFRDSLIYVQNPSSMYASLVLGPKPGETVLDLAASPGGKTLHLVSLMENEGKVSAVEVVRGRYFKLQANLKRYGATIVRTYLTDGRTVGRKTGERFDKVLLDAPCSGESRIHQRDPESWRFWKPRKIKEQARKQFGLIRSAFDALKPGGTLVYCTCSFAPEENEAVVSDFLHDFGNAEACPILPPFENFQPGLTHFETKVYHPDVARTIRILPTQLMDGFFLARIRKLPQA